jgi:hypothetical protein
VPCTLSFPASVLKNVFLHFLSPSDTYWRVNKFLYAQIDHAIYESSSFHRLAQVLQLFYLNMKYSKMTILCEIKGWTLGFQSVWLGLNLWLSCSFYCHECAIFPLQNLVSQIHT